MLYSLVNLLHKPVDGYFYRAQLNKTQKPKKDNFFFVEKILGHKVVNKKKYFLVKFLYYSDQFNEYILESDITQNYEDLI